jgi:hypothetical protein
MGLLWVRLCCDGNGGWTCKQLLLATLEQGCLVTANKVS